MDPRFERLNQCLAALPNGAASSARSKNDFKNLLRLCPALQPSVGTFINNAGVSEQMLKLGGTIPVRYNKAEYNIPVLFWIGPSYPDKPPIMFVDPTPAMAIEPSHANVEHDGRVVHEYLSKWNKNQSSLAEFEMFIASAFGHKSPVFARRQPPVYKPKPTPVYKPKPTPTYNPKPTPAYNPVLTPAYKPNPAPAYHTGGSPKAATQKDRDGLRALLVPRATKEVDELNVKIATAQSIQSKLKQGSKQIQDNKATLLRRKQELGQFLATLEQETAKAQQELAESKRAPPSVDELIVPTDPLSEQLIDAVAAAAAKEDLMYHLQRALSEKKIDCDTFLKVVRQQARKQFFDKALVKKILRAKSQSP